MQGDRALGAAVKENGQRPTVEIIRRSAVDLEKDERLQAWRPAVTCPDVAAVPWRTRALPSVAN